MEYLVQRVSQGLVEASTIGERFFVRGKVEVELMGWELKRRGGFFEKSECSVLLYSLPPELQAKWNEFADGVIKWVKEIKQKGE